MTANFTQRNEGVIVINFARLQEGVTLYPDLVKVQVSGGRVVGLEAGNYWRNHVERDLPEVTFSYQQALEAVNSRLNIISARLALIPSDTSYGRLDGERLCYEFTCSLGQSRYLVYIDAQTGVEASILNCSITAWSERTCVNRACQRSGANEVTCWAVSDAWRNDR